MENKELENKQLNDEQVKEVAGGGFFTDVCEELGIPDAGKFLDDAVDAVKSRIIPEPPKPNPIRDPNSFRIPDKYDDLK